MTAAAVFFLFWDLGKGSLASWDEAIYASVAKNVFLSGDWLRLQFEGCAWADKPPLATWVTALCYRLFGLNEFSARAFSAFCGMGTVLMTYFIGRSVFNRWTGFLGALILLSSSHFLRFARFGVLDVPLTFFLSTALYFFWQARIKNRYFIYCGIALGITVMVKGFAAFFLFPVILVYCLAARRMNMLACSSFWIGMGVAALIALPWHLYLFVLNSDNFVNGMLLKHLFLRSQTAIDGHSGNAYFYVRTLVNKYHPWILIAIVSGPWFLFRALKDREEEFVFLASWMFVIFAIITYFKTKLAWYVIPIYPALSISAAYFFAKIFSEKYANFIRLLFLGILALHVPYSHIFSQDYSADIRGISPVITATVPKGQVLYLYDYHETPAITFYTGYQAAYLDDEAAFFKKAGDNDFYCLIHPRKMPDFRRKMSSRGLRVRGSFQDLNLVSR